MACKKYIYAAGDTTWVTTFMEAVERSWKGLNNTSLTNYTTTAVCAIDEGSVFEVAGSIYITTSATAITASVATGICYIYVTGTATNAIFTWNQTEPIWRGDYQGYYQSASSTIRALGGVYYNGSSYVGKWVYGIKQIYGVDKRMNDPTSPITGQMWFRMDI